MIRLIKGGKIFGVLNILDIAIIALLLAVILPMLHYYIIFNEKGIAEQKILERFLKQQSRETVGFQTGFKRAGMDVAASFKNLREADIAKVKAGDKDALSNGTVFAEVLWVGEPKPNYFFAELGTESKSILRRSEGHGLYSLPVRLRLNGIISDGGVFSFKTKVLKRLGIYIFNSGSYEADFVVEEGAGE